MTTPTTAKIPGPAGLFRRFAAGFYDGLLLLALAMIAGILVFLAAGGMSRPIGTLQAPSLVERLANLLLVVTFVTLYFGYGWRKAGQTLGMKAWKIRAEYPDGTLLHWGGVLRRLGCAAPFYLLLLMSTLGFMQQRHLLALVLCLPMLANAAWLLWKREGALHDLWSGTRVVVVQEPPKD
jgi:uncharacterized RDD family membrane protein YckC